MAIWIRTYGHAIRALPRITPNCLFTGISGVNPNTASVGDEEPGQAIAYDNNERAGEPVVHELAVHQARYRDHITQC